MCTHIWLALFPPNLLHTRVWRCHSISAGVFFSFFEMPFLPPIRIFLSSCFVTAGIASTAERLLVAFWAGTAFFTTISTISIGGFLLRVMKVSYPFLHMSHTLKFCYTNTWTIRLGFLYCRPYNHHHWPHIYCNDLHGLRHVWNFTDSLASTSSMPKEFIFPEQWRQYLLNTTWSRTWLVGQLHGGTTQTRNQALL